MMTYRGKGNDQANRERGETEEGANGADSRGRGALLQGDVPTVPASAIRAKRVLENIHAERIPAALQTIPRWVVWKWELRTGRNGKAPKLTKPPFQTNGKNAKTDTPRTWTTFPLAVEALQRGGFDGLGFVLTGEEFFGFDFDHVRDPASGEIKPDAEAWIRELDSYAEVSPSGTGVRVFARGGLPAGGRKRGDVECYSKGRYLTVTGERLAGAPEEIRERTAAAARVHAEVFPKKDDRKPAPPPRPTLEMDDAELLDRARAARNGERFSQLFDRGDLSAHDGDHSVADLALCGSLAFWTGGDAERMDRLFRASGLMRPKWNEKRGEGTYGMNTIQKAIAEATDFYTGRNGGPERKQDPRTGREIPSPAAPPIVETYNLTDLGNARRFIRDHGGDVRYSPLWKCWLLWDGKRWARDERGDVVQLVKKTIGGMLKEAAGLEETPRKALASHALKTESAGRIRAMLELAQTEPGIAVLPIELDADPDLFNVENGTIDLRIPNLRKHKREDLITKLSPVRFDPAARSKLWERFLTEAQPDSEARDFLQMAAGYCLRAGNIEEVLFLLFGPAASGKTTFFEGLRGAYGEYGKTADFSAFLASREPRNHQAGIVPLVGSRLVTSSEMDAGGGKRLAEGTLNVMAGGESMRLRDAYEKSFEVRPSWVTWLATNTKPKLTDDEANGIWRRILLLDFSRPVPRDRQDPELKARLREPEAAAGILTWLIDGLVAWREMGRLKIPSAVVRSTEAYREEQDPVKPFLDEMTEEDSEAFALSADLWAAYQEWAGRGGMNRTEFGKRIAARFERGKHPAPGNRRVVYRGIKLLGGGARE